MSANGLSGRRVLVVEDEYLLADEIAVELADHGAVVLGPVSNLAGGFALLDESGDPDAAVLDVNLGGEPVFPLADRLIGRAVPLIFTTGYDRSVLPERFAHIPTCEKPISADKISAVLTKLILD